ncbi:helix-turn-helix domain-containing protein [Legionella feeleii]|uniref:Global DNA-binding transcriptional dual regulator n=1 Tax=Legionella feeleii TaxID=453 RepID=A0A378KLC7_9GAMM|nr:helix-turn-helix domain-containing protein [Legionella feeleii]STX88302.1 global DNA-binding transcriptional dual regulator [Legionella feeleii]
MQSVTETKSQSHMENNSFAQAIESEIKRFEKHDGISLYGLIMETVERALLQTIMNKCLYNQSHAARMLGLSRTNLRLKLRHYFGDKYFKGQVQL